MRIVRELWVTRKSGKELLTLDSKTLEVKLLPYSLEAGDLPELAEACHEAAVIINRLRQPEPTPGGAQ
jgi:hypothetical protein